MLARLVGIPSRIAVGYTGGTPGAARRWQVTTADAHAWPELYFPGEGWLRFEPTPSGTREQGTAAVPVYAGGSSGSSGSVQNLNPNGGPSSPAFTAPSGKRTIGTNRLLPQGATGSASSARARSSGLGYAIGIPIGIFLLLTWPALTRLGTRRRRWLTASGDAGTAHAAWRELTDDLADFGLPGTPGETPRAVARRVTADARLDPESARAVVRIVTAEERARYAPAAQPGAGLKADVAQVRRAIAGSVSRRDRVRARLLPASTLQSARRLGQRASDIFSWLDSSWPAVRRQIRGLAHR